MSDPGDWKKLYGALDYQTVIDRCGGEVASLSTRERWDALQQWRECFAARMHEMTGSWKIDQFEWHVFSYKYSRALHGHHAVEEYLSQQPHEFLIVPESQRLDAVRVSGGILPDLRPVMNDIYVWPTDLQWTMAFTHEESIGLGPYFSQREWLAESHAPKQRPRRS